MNPWWHEQCPRRGPALSHTQDGTLHCIHCGLFPAPVVQQVMPPLDVAARLRQLGLVNDNGQPTEQDTGMEDIKPDPNFDENAPREPSMAVGWPVGPAYGRGRSWNNDGSLNPRDIPRLEDILHREKRNGYR